MGHDSAVFGRIAAVLFFCQGLLVAAACQHNDTELSHSTAPLCACPSKPVEELARQFNTIFNALCIHLLKISVPIDDFTWTMVYAITSDNSCLQRLEYDSLCFQPTSRRPRCSWSYSWVDLGPDFFPRFVSNLDCGASGCCTAVGRGVPFLQVLRRQNRCDENGEVWQQVTVRQNINLACGCSAY